MYVAIEGVIGVGKTTLARLLQPTFDAELFLEAFEENPFLSDFYGDRQRYAFQTQIFFLLSRYRQQREISSAALEDKDLISDYTFDKDALFARLNLFGDELATYTQVHKALAERVRPPDLVVFLRANTDIAMQRIAMRDRSYERNMDYAYINDLNQAYEEFFLNERGKRFSPLTPTHSILLHGIRILRTLAIGFGQR
jgi:deoxyguanosine kinase